MKNIAKISLYLVVFISMVAGFFTLKDPILYVDETVHHQVINNFCHLNFTIHPNLTNIPAYHAILGGACFFESFLISMDSIHAIRFTSLLLSLTGLYFLLLIARKIKHKYPELTTLQLFLLPIAFPFFFLVYTDIPAITPIALALLLTYYQRYTYAGLLMTLSVAFRQNNIIWLGWLAIFIFLKHFPHNWDLKSVWNNLISYLKKVWSFILGTLVFVGFVKLNGGISLAKAEEWAHPSFSLHLGNIHLMLILFSIIFLPLIISNWKRLNRLCKDKRLLVAALFTFALLGYNLVFKFENSHPYNIHEFAIHNKILVIMTQSFTNRVLSLIPLLFAILTLFATKLRKPAHYTIYVFAALFVLPSWLVEPRYYIIPFYLFLLFKEQDNLKTNISLAIWEFALAAILLYGTLNKFFLP